MQSDDIPLSLRIEFPEIAMYCCDDSQEILEKALKKIYEKYGKDRFISEVAVAMRSMKLEEVKAKMNTKNSED